MAPDAARAIGARHVVPLHVAGWEHFSDGVDSLRDAFEEAGLGDRLACRCPVRRSGSDGACTAATIRASREGAGGRARRPLATQHLEPGRRPTMQDSDELTETTTPTSDETEPSPDRLADPLARLVRFFRGPDMAAGKEDEATAEFNVFDLRATYPASAFPLARWGGYDRAAVDERIAELEGELDELRAQADPDRGVETEIRHLGDETAEILRVAHGKADAMVKKAQADAEARIAQAEAQAAQMVADAEERLRRLDRDTDLVWAERTRLTEDTKRLAEKLIQVADSAIERFPPEG